MPLGPAARRTWIRAALATADGKLGAYHGTWLEPGGAEQGQKVLVRVNDHHAVARPAHLPSTEVSSSPSLWPSPSLSA